jgi:hypothetical protein
VRFIRDSAWRVRAGAGQLGEDGFEAAVDQYQHVGAEQSEKLSCVSVSLVAGGPKTAPSRVIGLMTAWRLPVGGNGFRWGTRTRTSR